MKANRRRRRAGVALLALAGVLGLLVLGLAFTIYGELAAVLAIVCGAAGALILSRGSQPPTHGLVFNPPPGWPAPPADWSPPPGWQPDPTWPQPPAGWQFWSPSHEDAA